MQAKKQWMLVALLLIPEIAKADFNEPSMPISEYQKQEWHVEDGLPQSNVRVIIQTGNRQLLIGNSEGITSFDGVRFLPFRIGSKPDNANEPVNSLLSSRDGSLWIGTDDRGVIRQTGQMIASVSEDAGFHQERVRGMFEDRAGVIWVATHNGIERIIGGKVQFFERPGLVPGDITQPFGQDREG